MSPSLCSPSMLPCSLDSMPWRQEMASRSVRLHHSRLRSSRKGHPCPLEAPAKSGDEL